MSNTVPVTYDAESAAYLKRYPELRPLLAVYGADGARLHYNTHGKTEGRTWGAAAPVAAAPTGPVETVSTAPMPAMYGNDARSWDAYMKAGRTATEGMNQMPGVFSDYGSIPTDDAAAQKMFYPASNGGTSANGMASGGPLMASALAALTGQGGGLQQGGQSSGTSTFDRIINAGPEAFSNGLITEYGLRGGMTPDEMKFYMQGRDYYNR